MALPTISHLTFDLKIPSTQEVIQFRPFLVSEEKILLVAKEENTTSAILRAILQILNNCIETKIDVDELTVFDVEYIFIKLRSKSVNNIVKLTIKEPHDDENDETEEKEHLVEVDLNDIEIDVPEMSDIIKINDTILLKLRYPTVRIAQLVQEEEAKEGKPGEELMLHTITTIWEGDQEFNFQTFTREERLKFLGDMSMENSRDIHKFFNSMPKLSHTITYGDNKTMRLEGLSAFFDWG